MNKYLEWKYSEILRAGDAGSSREYLSAILECLQFSNQFMTQLYKSGLFLSRLRLHGIVRVGQSMLRTYAECAGLAYARNSARFTLNPKLHMLAHIVLDLSKDMQAGKRPLNPISWSCQMPEDFINKIATFSRSVHSMTVSQRTIDLYKMELAKVL